MTSKYLAIDPGMTSGWAVFDEVGTIIEYGQFAYADATKELKVLIHDELLTIIVEDYKNHPWMKQKGWGKNETSKLIGKIETLAELRDIPIVLQSNTVKGIGYMYAGLKPPSNHSISHQFDAYAHGVYWLQTEGIRPVGKALLQQRQKDVDD